MDAYDEILGLCKERDVKRQQIETKKKLAETNAKHKLPEVAKPKIQKPLQKPLSYEELMKRAENNSNNTLSIADLKPETRTQVPARSTIETGRSKYPVSRNTNPIKKMVSDQKKTVKVIKRNMQPRSEISDLVTLNQKKRDLRSIEQIQFELKQQAKSEKKPEKPVKVEEDPEKYYAKNYSSIISNLFGYDKNKYAEGDEDDLSDMEADYKTVLAEEARSTRLGREEDLEEEAKEIERKRRKAALLKSQKKYI